MRRILLGLGVLFLGVPLEAQDRKVNPPPVPIQFQFAPPGARALAMGATFVAIADDATAAESNPAGLTILTKPEISAHFRTTRFENEFVNALDSDQRGTFTSKVFSPAYFSFVYPLKNAAVSVYYQQATNFKSASSFSTQTDQFTGFPANIAFSSNADLLVDNIGASLAYKVSPKLAVGASVRASRARFTDTGDSFRYQELGESRNIFTSNESTTDSARTVTFNAGVLVNPNGKVSAGVFYRQGGKFDLTRTSRVTAAGPDFDPTDETTPEDFRYQIPDSFSGGLAFRPTDRWVLSGELTWIKYSVLSVSAQVLADNADTLEAIDDAVEVHFGTEYTFISGRTPFSIRAGVFTDPDHDGQKLQDAKQVHGTFGAGFVLGGRLQVDFAANFAKHIKEGLVSLVYRF